MKSIQYYLQGRGKLVLASLLIFINITLLSETGYCAGQGSGSIRTDNKANEVLEYYYYIPSRLSRRPFHTLVCMHGLNGSGQPFVIGSWARFAEENEFIIVAPTFKFDQENWRTRTSYQFPSVWSGDALLEILEEVRRKVDISLSHLYFFGFSAGSQFSLRFALWKPGMCVAVAAHAPGGTIYPKKWIPVKFLLTVGQEDTKETDRVWRAKKFYEKAKELNISITYKEILGVGHWLTQEQIQLSIDFFRDIKMR